MVARIGSATSIRRTFLYNEHKVEKGAAKCIMAANYPIDLDQLDQAQKLTMLLKTAQKNSTVERPSIHISLNFAPGEQLSDEQLTQIATEYMQGIGFAGQPFLVYRHDDAAHPHIHIVTIKIRPDGTRIDTQNIGKNLSEPTRKLIENKYDLVQAEQQKGQLFQLRPVDASKVIYGNQTTKNAISGVLQHVLQGYRYTSLAELNAVLNLYNIQAERGSQSSSTYRHNGLVYRILDGEGKAVGVPLKASVLYNNPGLKFLEKQFLANDVKRANFRQQLRSTIDLTLLRNPGIDLKQFMQKMKSSGVQVVPRINEDGQLYGLTFVDHRSKCVFNGSKLGKKYSGASLFADRYPPKDKLALKTTSLEIPSENNSRTSLNPPQNTPPEHEHSTSGKGLLEELMDYQYSEQGVPHQWKKKKKRKKKR